MAITFGMKGSSYFSSQNTGGVENAVTLQETFLTPAEEVLISLLKILCMNT
jgi:hypothetical protein